MKIPPRCGALLAVLALVGCGVPSIQPGTSMSDVESRLGKPVDIVKAPDGDTVWQYPKGPYGQFTYMARFGADQRVKSFTQALTLDNFAKIQKGMSKDERTFCYLPFEHAEHPEAQAKCVALMGGLDDPDLVKWAEAHKVIIDRFGRFPHRNEVLGRATTAEEQAFLDAGGFAG